MDVLYLLQDNLSNAMILADPQGGGGTGGIKQIASNILQFLGYIAGFGFFIKGAFAFKEGKKSVLSDFAFGILMVVLFSLMAPIITQTRSIFSDVFL